jgi:Ca2+-binding RTX toxin-like protein
MALNSRLVFNEAYYLAQNPDVAAAIGKLQPDGVTLFTSGLDHFTRFGAAEGRVATPLFDAAAYAANNTDLADAGVTTAAQLRTHFYTYGAAEGRNAMSAQVFNLDYYKANNQDLVNAGLSDAQIVRHFYEYGAAEGRAATVNFSVAAYKAANADLAGLSDTVARGHWYTYGAGEGRAFPQLAQSYTLTASATQTAEGTAITYTITAALPATADTTFTYNVSGDTNGGTIDAAVTADFASSSGTVTFGVGETSKTFTVTPSIDSTVEGLEGFKVTLFNSNFAVVGTKTGVILDNSQAVGTTQTLVSTNDNLSGGAGNDTFNGVVTGANESGTTLQAGDVLAGGSGTDTLNISIAGSAGAAVTTAAINLTGIERISVSNFESSVNNNIIDLALVDSALTTLALSASSATGDTQFTNVSKVVAAELSNGSGDLTITYTTTASAGATVQALTLANQTGGTFTANGVETLNIASNTLANTVTLAGDALATVNVTGAVALTLGTLPNTATTVNASALTAALTTTLGTGTSVTVTGGSGDDVITTGAALSGGSVAGGSGADTLIVGADAHINTSTIGARYTGFETLLLNGTQTTAAAGDDYTDRTQNVGHVAGVTTYGLSNLTLNGFSGDNTGNATVAYSFTGGTTGQTLSLSGISYTDSSTDDSQNDDVALTVSSALTTDGSADVLNVALSGNGTTNAATSADELSLSLTLTNYETVNIASAGSSTNTINTLDSASLKSLVVTGSRAVTIATLSNNTATTTINASAATGNVSIGATANGSTTAMTITGGSGNDTFVAGSGADSIDGGTGNDNLSGAGGADTIIGGTGNDVINGGAGIDSLSGGDGNDTFTVTTASDFQGLTAAEVVDGGSGTDTLKFEAAMTLTGTDLTKVTSIEAFEFAATGASSITLSNAYFTAAGVTAVTITDSNTSGALTVDASGLSAANSITVDADKGAANNDSLAGGSGADTFKFTTSSSATALTSTDTVVGGAGSDTLAITLDTNNLTAVTLTGVSGVEKITVTGSGTLTAALTLDNANFGGSVVGVIDASGMTGTGAFTLVGTSEANALSVTGGSGADNLTGGTGADTISGGTGADTIVGGAGIDNLSGGVGDDVFTVATVTHFTGLTAAETVSGGSGNDILDFTENAATTVSATDLLGINGIETIRLSGNNTGSLTLTEQVLAANGVTTLKIVDNQNSEALVLSASTLSSAYSLDITAAGAATGKNDNIVAGAGADIIRYSTANTGATLEASDTVDGGAGSDTLAITLDGGTNLTAVTLTAVSNIEKITFTGTGAATASVTTADGTFASVTGASVDASGITGTGTLTFSASAEDDSTFSIVGSLNNDTLTGGQLADTINGGAGADSITGGSGADSLIGGLGSDVFVYAAVAESTGTTADTISDFTSGTDVIQLTLNYSALSAGIDVNTNSVSSVNDLSAKRGEFVYDSTAGTLSVNVNNDNLITTQDYKINVGTVAAGDLRFVVTGTSFGDSIVGGVGADSIVGGSGADTLTGGSGADTIVGGVGSDTISLGGADAARDVVSYTSTTAANLALEGSDSITGFQTAATRDIINFASGALVNGTNNGYANLTATNGTVGTNDVIVTLGGTNFTSTADLTVNATALAIIDALDTSNIANGDTVLFLLDNGTNVYAWLFTETATNTGTVDTAELTLLGTLNSIADAGSFSGQAATITTLAAAAATDYFSIG